MGIVHLEVSIERPSEQDVLVQRNRRDRLDVSVDRKVRLNHPAIRALRVGRSAVNPRGHLVQVHQLAESFFEQWH